MILGKLVFITGGARSGKSTFAEKLAIKQLEIEQLPAEQITTEQLAVEQRKNVLYIATAIPFDDEMKIRIKKHKERRPAKWQTVEAYKDLDKVIEINMYGKSVVLLDCITVMITNLMVEKNLDWDKVEEKELYNVETEINCEIKKFINTAKNKGALFLVVSNEIGMGLVPEYAMSRIFRDIAGRVNQKISEAADEVFFCVSGIPIKIKQ